MISNFFEDNIPKKLHLLFMTPIYTENGIEFEEFSHITPEKIVGESANFTMGLLEGNKFALGSYVIPEFSIDVIYENANYKNKICRVWLEIDNGNVVDRYGIIFGKVSDQLISAERDKATLKIRSIIADAFETDVSYNSLFISGASSKVGLFYEALLKETYVSTGLFPKTPLQSGYQEFMSDISNLVSEFNQRFGDMANLSVKALSEDKTVKIVDCWRMLGEFLGSHIRIEQPRVYLGDIATQLYTSVYDVKVSLMRIDDTTEILYPNENTYPSNSLYPLMLLSETPSSVATQSYSVPYFINCEYDEFVNTKYDAIYFKYGDIEFVKTDTDAPYTKYPAYEIVDNLLYNGISDIDISNRLEPVLNYLKKRKYIVSSLRLPFYPDFHAGDNIILETSRSEVFAMPLLYCNTQGINSIIANIEAKPKNE